MTLTWYNDKNIKDKKIITNSFGSWCFLTSEEYKNLSRDNIDNELKSKLIDSGFYYESDSLPKLYRESNRHLYFGPYFHTIEIKNKESVMSEEVSKDIISDLRDLEIPSIQLKFICDRLNEKAVSIINNFVESLKEEKKCDFLLEIKDLRDIEDVNLNNDELEIISFLENKNVHNKNNNYLGGESFKNQKNAYDDLKENYNIHLVPRITKFTIDNGAEELIKLYYNLGEENVNLFPSSYFSTQKDVWEDIKFKPDEFKVFWRNGIINILENDMKEIFGSALSSKIINRVSPIFKPLISPTGRGRIELFYSNEGDIFTSREGYINNLDMFKMGDINQDSINDLVIEDEQIELLKYSNLTSIIPLHPFNSFMGISIEMNYRENECLVPSMDNFELKVYENVIEQFFEFIYDDSKKKKLKSWTK